MPYIKTIPPSEATGKLKEVYETASGPSAARGKVAMVRQVQSLNANALAAWVAAGHSRGLTVALAGQLTIDDLSPVLDTGADIAGVRGAACEGGRSSRISAERVNALKATMCRPLIV